MVFAAELDDVRQEIRRGGNAVSNQLVFWPSIVGLGNVRAVSLPPATYEIKDEDGLIMEAGSMSQTTIDAVTKFHVGVDATDTDTWLLKEDFSLIISWDYLTDSHVNTVRFDCVLEPIGDLNLTLNSFVEEVVDMDERLQRQALAQAESRTAEEHASVLAVKAMSDVRRWLKSSADATGNILPRLIVDREAIRRVVIAKAIARAYRAEGGGLDSESRQLHDDWILESESRFRELGVLKYDLDEDGLPDSTVGPFSSIQTIRAY